MKPRFYLIVICLVFLSGLFISNPANAVIANPNPVQYTQPDGSVITIIMKGDEFIHWASTIDGYTLLSDQNNAYEFAREASDGKLVFSGIIAHNPEMRGIQEDNFLRTIKKGLFFSASQISEMKKLFSPAKATNATEVGGFPTVGVRNHLVILANFSNTTTIYSQTTFNNLMNQDNYNGIGSFRDYYLEVSYGQLTINNTVTIWVTLPNSHNFYGPQSEWGTFAYDAVVAADEQAGIDYSLFDNDGDGNVDGFCIVHQGRGQEESGNTNDIWSHSSDLAQAGYTASQRTFDGVKVLDYTTVPEKGNATAITTIGVICHEFGHNLGAPDFYDADYNTGGLYDGTGNWDIMANGSWNGSPAGSRPAHHNPWTKTFYTWLTPMVLSSQQNVLLSNIQDNMDVVRYNTTTPGEYFLCENRQKTGFNSYIPGHGMIIYHVDGNYISSHFNSNNINNTSHQGLYPMSATSTTANGIMTSSSSTINTGGCPWPGTSNKTTFTDATIPNSKSWAGETTDLPLINIIENTTTKEVTFCFIACPDPNDPVDFTATATNATQIDLNWNQNANNNPVLVAFNMTDTFGIPSNGTAYSNGGLIPGGGTVLYNGSGTSFNHTGLNPDTRYYYKIWSITAGTLYSTGVISNAKTFCSPVTYLPFYENFTAGNIPACWSQIDHQSCGQIWQFGIITGYTPAPVLTDNYAYLNSHTYGNGNMQNADLITPTLDFSSSSDIILQFSHFFREKSGSSGTVSYSIDNGLTWTGIETFIHTTSNPAVFNQTIPALNGQSQVKIKWNFTGTNAYYWAVDNVLISSPTLSISPSNQDVTVNSGVTTFDILANSPWTITSDQAWCTPANSTGNGSGTIFVMYTQNPSTQKRVASITVSSPGITPAIVTVTQDGVVGISEISSNDISIVPNPNHGQFLLSSEKLQGESFEIIIYNSKGVIILSKLCKGHDSFTFDLSSKPKGIYAMKISVHGHTFIRKILIE